ncbi:MAG TPA: TlpA disulfide reductase family protein [Chloroflexota bacterium]|nr:TlpA disulfide reductase family protein [Chloroflexota bacterium]
MKDRAVPPVNTSRQTRAQRRAAEREAQPGARRRTRTDQRRIPTASIIGGIVTLAIVLAIVIHAITSTNSTVQNKPGLTDPNALNPASSLLQVGQKAPDFTLKDVLGLKYNLASQRGHVVFLEFFAVWCPNCQAEAPTIERLANTYESRGVRVWTVLANPYGKDYDTSNRTDLRLADRGDLAWYARQFKATYPALVDPKFATVNQYGVNSYPGLYIIDKQGKVSFASMGVHTYAALSHEVNKALAGK